MKAGDKVVFIGTHSHPYMKLPKRDTEALTITSVCTEHESNYNLGGYEYAPDGRKQSFMGNYLRLVDEHGYTNHLTKEMANKPTGEEGIEIIEPEKIPAL